VDGTIEQPRLVLDAPRIVPVFPLADTVFFPRTSLPLHIFEPRYRAMVRDASAGDKLIAIALADGDEFHSVGTVGQIRELRPLEDGRYDLRLEGLQRVELTELPSGASYRQVRADPRPESLSARDQAAIDDAKLELLAVISVLRSASPSAGQNVVLHQHLPLEVLVNAACAGLPIEARLRQELLEEDDLSTRRNRLTDYLSIVLDAVTRFASNAGPAGGLYN